MRFDSVARENQEQGGAPYKETPYRELDLYAKKVKDEVRLKNAHNHSKTL